MLYIETFFLAFIASFTGSIQLGFVNVEVIQTSVQQGFRAGRWVAIGGCVPEVLYCVLALFCIQYFNINQRYFDWFVVLVFAVMAYHFYTSSALIPMNHQARKHQHFLRGFWLCLINPQQLFFWVACSSIILGLTDSSTFSTKIVFVSGGVCGTFCLLYLYSYLSIKYKNSLFQIYSRYPINKFLGIAFFFISIYKLLILLQ